MKKLINFLKKKFSQPSFDQISGAEIDNFVFTSSHYWVLFKKPNSCSLCHLADNGRLDQGIRLSWRLELLLLIPQDLFTVVSWEASSDGIWPKVFVRLLMGVLSSEKASSITVPIAKCTLSFELWKYCEQFSFVYWSNFSWIALGYKFLLFSLASVLLHYLNF